MFEELETASKFGGIGGFLPGMKQIANVAALPGIVGVNICLNFVYQIKFVYCIIEISWFT